MPLIRNIPNYGQHPNGCGLASLLMLSDLPQNTEFADFLNEIWDRIEGLFKSVSYDTPEYRWAIVFQYILLKVQGYSEETEKQEIDDFFNERMEWAFEDQRIMNKFNQENARKILLNRGKQNNAYTYSSKYIW